MRDLQECESAAKPADARPSQWFALSVKPRFDKAVARTLETKGYETFLPLYRKQHRYGARSKDSDLPLFPGYVCCRFDVQNRLPILTTPGVLQILGAGNIPTALSNLELASLQIAIAAQLPVEPFPFVELGQRVRIDHGPLTGIEGIVVSLKQTLRLVLSITLLQRSVLVEIDGSRVSAGEIRQYGAKTFKELALDPVQGG
jgi:transcription antitermination factor NusG